MGGSFAVTSRTKSSFSRKAESRLFRAFLDSLVSFVNTALKTASLQMLSGLKKPGK
jgi:hypothetical protein